MLFPCILQFSAKHTTIPWCHHHSFCHPFREQSSESTIHQPTARVLQHISHLVLAVKSPTAEQITLELNRGSNKLYLFTTDLMSAMNAVKQQLGMHFRRRRLELFFHLLQTSSSVCNVGGLQQSVRTDMSQKWPSGTAAAATAELCCSPGLQEPLWMEAELRDRNTSASQLCSYFSLQPKSAPCAGHLWFGESQTKAFFASQMLWGPLSQGRHGHICAKEKFLLFLCTFCVNPVAVLHELMQLSGAPVQLLLLLWTQTSAGSFSQPLHGHTYSNRRGIQRNQSTQTTQTSPSSLQGILT